MDAACQYTPEQITKAVQAMERRKATERAKYERSREKRLAYAKARYAAQRDISETAKI
jgi:hypothetical protein